jgi:hypothetical protein
MKYWDLFFNENKGTKNLKNFFFLQFTIFKFTRKRKVDEEDIQNDSQC